MGGVDPDRALMALVAERDEAAFRELVAKYLHFCTRFAERMLGNRQDAEDIAQSVCLKIWKEAPNWQPRAKFSTWLYRVTLNACIDHRRKVIPFGTVELDTIEDDRPGAEALMASRQADAQVRAAVAALSERQRAAVILSYYEQIENREAAAAMGLELGTFQQLLYRARQTLKLSLAAFMQEKKNG